MTIRLKKYNNDESKHTNRPRFRLTPLAAFVASTTLLLSTAGYAQDARSAAEIQAEVTRLKQQLEKEEQALAIKTPTPAKYSNGTNTNLNTDSSIRC